MIRRYSGPGLGIGLAAAALATSSAFYVGSPTAPASDYRPAKWRDTKAAPPSVIKARKRRKAQRRARRITRLHLK